jgi:hypothetical protein
MAEQQELCGDAIYANLPVGFPLCIFLSADTTSSSLMSTSRPGGDELRPLMPSRILPGIPHMTQECGPLVLSLSWHSQIQAMF